MVMTENFILILFLIMGGAYYFDQMYHDQLKLFVDTHEDIIKLIELLLTVIPLILFCAIPVYAKHLKKKGIDPTKNISNKAIISMINDIVEYNIDDPMWDEAKKRDWLIVKLFISFCVISVLAIIIIYHILL